MSFRVVSIVEARRVVRRTADYLVCVEARHAKLFKEPGWIELQPPRDGGVLFLNRERERRSLLAGGAPPKSPKSGLAE